jgi:aspartyl-tRNA(Asn)/glutamyl-tRNA(Gln) amidotransferase subunit A
MRGVKRRDLIARLGAAGLGLAGGSWHSWTVEARQSTGGQGPASLQPQPTEVTDLTLSQAAGLIKARALSPVELATAYLKRIDRLNPTINAFVTVTSERAMADARRAGEEIAGGKYRGPLHGIPIAHKDLYATAGIRTTAGSKVLSDWVPDRDARVVAMLSDAGAVLLGKLNTFEFAYGFTTNNPHYGNTRNPWALSRTPGGSSGGSGAAIAASLAVATTGTDTGGSIRVPASFCGCVGLKPTYGRISRSGIVPLSWTLDHAGPLTRTVEDAALMLQAMAGYDPDDYSTLRVPVGDYLGNLRRGVRGLRIGVPRSFFFEMLDDEVRAALDQALEQFRALGAIVSDVDLPGMETVSQTMGVVEAGEGAAYHGDNWKARPNDFGAALVSMLKRQPPTAAALIAAYRYRYALAEKVRRVLQRVDVLVTPTTAGPAPPIDDPRLRIAGRTASIGRCTEPFNGSEVPTLSIPCGFTAAGLPIGMQISGRPLDEATVLRAGYAYEQASPWRERRPVLPTA